MEIKKSPKANLENKKTFFVEIGLVIALAICLVAFEWKTYDKSISLMDMGTQVVTEEEMVPIIPPDIPPPPPMPQVPIVTDVIEIVDDNTKIKDDLILSTEDNKNLGVQVLDYVPKQVVAEEVEEDIPVAVVEEKPKFMGGDENEFTKWVFKNMVYPEIAKENNIQGRVILSFVVGPDGRVVDVKVLRGVDPSLDKEALRVVNMSPRWTPGKQRNKPVRVKYTFPVIFQLR
ncbi:MAG: energy transducer TonB [Bacteroidales bacterium]|nr:energy transducer TonB [Bacteroidales bacterium]